VGAEKASNRSDGLNHQNAAMRHQSLLRCFSPVSIDVFNRVSVAGQSRTMPHGLPSQCFLPAFRIAEGPREHIFHAGMSMQKDSEAALWGDEQPQGSVIASDFYNASAIAMMKDQRVSLIFYP